MTFDTKLNIGDTIWMMLNNKPEQFIVRDIRIHYYIDVVKMTNIPMTIIDYTINSNHAGFNEFELGRRIFRTKQELIAIL